MKNPFNVSMVLVFVFLLLFVVISAKCRAEEWLGGSWDANPQHWIDNTHYSEHFIAFTLSWNPEAGGYFACYVTPDKSHLSHDHYYTYEDAKINMKCMYRHWEDNKLRLVQEINGSFSEDMDQLTLDDPIYYLIKLKQVVAGRISVPGTPNTR